MRISGSKIMATKITGDALESYLKCKTKAHLKLAGHQGSMSDYEGLLVESRQEVRRQAIAKILAQHPETEVARDIPLTAAALRAGPSFVLDTTLEDDLLTLRFAGLKRVDGSSKLGDFHYVPMLFHEGRKVGKEQRLLLELHGLILSQIQGRLPANGVVWHGRECKATRVRLNPDKRRAERFLQEVREMGSAESPTRLILNEHCQVCEFRQRCHDQAVQEDNISLIRGMSERSIRKYQKKGITTLSQLSCTFRPRKNNKREVKNRRPHSFGLQALAVRDGRIYVYGTPDLPTSPIRIYLDVEGDPDRNFVYLIGLVIDERGAERRHSFWADDEAGEERIFREFLDVVGSYEDFSLFFYGRYETDYLNRMRGRSGSKRLINRLLDGSVNVLQAMYGKVYFPTYSNGLKDVAPALGFSWTEKDASGVQSLVWRHRWERGGGEDFKGKLLAYNIEDCLALKRVTEVLYGIAAAYDEPDGGQPGIGEGGGIPWVKATDALPDYRKWSRVRFACPDFDFINKCSYFDYQRQRVHIRTSRAVRQAEKRRRKGKAKKGLRVSQRVVLRARKCPVCGGPAHQKGRRSFCKLVYDLKITPFGVKRRVIECRAFVHHCPACVLSFMPRKYKRLDRFGHGLKSWAMYLHVAHQISFPKIETLLQDFFGLAVDGPRIYTFKMMLADYYSPTVKRIIQNLVSGGVIYADETEIKLKKTKGYVWVLSNTEEVLYLYRPTREVGFLEKLLHGFAGVLVTDFYPAYDSMGCAQQKCLVHLIRDLNAGLLENPFDEEFKHFAFEFGRLLRSIVTTIDGHGLKRSHLAKHRREVDHFYRDVVGRAGISEASAKFRDRFTKYRDQMFRFLEHDGVAWNNNYAEHAIKQFAHYRVIADGNMNESGLNGYLALLSVSQTCKNKGVGLLNYFLSGERDIDSYRTGRRCKRQMPSLRPLPDRFYIPWPESLYPDNGCDRRMM